MNKKDASNALDRVLESLDGPVDVAEQASSTPAQANERGERGSSALRLGGSSAVSGARADNRRPQGRMLPNYRRVARDFEGTFYYSFMLEAGSKVHKRSPETWLINLLPLKADVYLVQTGLNGIGLCQRT